MGKREFVEYNKREALRSNLKISCVFIAILVVSIFLAVITLKLLENNKVIANDGWAMLGYMLMAIFLVFIILIIYSVIVASRLRLHESFINNIKEAAGLFICNGITSIFILAAFRWLPFLIYIILAYAGILLPMVIRYALAKGKTSP